MSTVQHCDHPHIERINLGAVSAYAVAKKHGFTGTEAEWEAYIANASIKAQEAARDAASAAASAADARSSLGQIRDQNEGLFLRYDEPASLTEENKAQVRENIGLTYTEMEAVSFLGEVAAVEGSVAVYADIPGYWRVSTGSLDRNNWTVHTRMISIKGFEKVYGRAWMRDYGYYVAYFDENYQLMDDISLVGGLSDELSNFRFGNNSESEPLDLATAKAAGACYISISSAGSSTDYPYIFWGKPVSAPVQQGFDPGIHDVGRMESHGVSYVDFGARLDGEHDDTDAVIACHEYANAHGCPVYQHKGTVRMKTARHRYHGERHNVQIKTDVDWTGTTFLILPEDQGTDDQGNPLDNGEQIAFAVTPEVDYEDVSLTAEQIAELHDDWLNIPFLKTSYPNEIVTFSTTDIVIGRRDGEETYTAPSYYSETVTADRNGGLIDGHMFRDMTECEHVTMAHRSIMDHPITIKGGTFLRGTGNRFVNPYYLYITRSNVTIQGLKVDAGTRHETGDRAYRGELIRANYAYNLCFRDCVCENFSTFFPWADRYNNNVCYVLVCTHCSNVLIDHCNFLRGWGPMQTSWCKHVTVRNSTMGRVDNHYGCRDYLIEGCTMVTSHSNINVGYGDGYLTIRDCKFIKTRDYDTMMNSRIVYCREDMCAIFSGDITIENIQIESDYETTVLYAALESTWEFKAESTNQILPMKLPKVRMRNIYFRHVGWTEGHHFTLLEYGVNRSASAVLYGYIMADNAVIDGVYSDMEARVLPMLEHVTLNGNEPWVIKVRNYNCEVQVTKDINIDPDEDMDFNRPLVMLLPDPDVNFQQQIDELSRQDSQESAREAKEAEIGAQESQRKAAMSQTHAHEEAVRASRSQTAAAESQTDAAASAEAAASSETNAASSETNAAASEAAAAASAAAAQAVLDSIPADYTAMAQDVGDLKSALESIVTDDNFIELTKTSDIFSTEEDAVANQYGKSTLAGYYLCTMTAEKDFDFYASGPILETTRAIFISIYNDEISAANYQTDQSYKRTAQGGTLPTENSKGHVYKGQIFAVSVYTPASDAGDFIINANCSGYRLSSDTALNETQIEQAVNAAAPGGVLDSGISLGAAQIEQAVNAVAPNGVLDSGISLGTDQIEQAVNAVAPNGVLDSGISLAQSQEDHVLEQVITTTQPFVALTKSSDLFTIVPDTYATTGNAVPLAGYLLCYFTATNDCQIYFDAETLAKSGSLFLSIYNNAIASGNNVICYRRSDSNLPAENSKAQVSAGQIIAISIYTPSSSPADFCAYCNYAKKSEIKESVQLNAQQIEQVINELPPEGIKFTNYAHAKKIAWFGDSISELKSLPHTAGSLMGADVYDCSIRGSTIGRTYSNYDEFSFYHLVTAVISGDFSAQFAQLDAYEQAQGRTYPGIRENLTTLSNLNFSTVDYVVLLQGTNDFGITAVHAAEGYATKVAEMQARMDDAISRFLAAYPHLKFYIISPPFRATPTEDYYGDTLADYIAAEKEVAEKYAIPFYDLLVNSRICDQNKTTYMLSDSGVYVHPNDYGDAWLAELCAKFISVN